MEHQECRHCGLTIRYLGDWVNGWVHLAGSVFCDSTLTVRAAPSG